jgi:DUF4097 and DUF4098 domain-containing protein YvlB
MRRLIRPAAALMTVLALAWGCVTLVDALAIEHRRASLTVDDAVGVVLDASGDGTVRVVGDVGADGITVDFSWREGLRSAGIDAVTAPDGRLRIVTRCPTMASNFCTVDATVRVPMGTAVEGRSTGTIEVVGLDGVVDVSSDNGAIRVEGGEGRVTARSDNDTVAVTDRTGPLDLASDNGRVRTEGVDATTVTATSDNGDIDLALRTAPDRIVTRTDNGTTSVVLPAEAPPYATDLSTRNGSVDALIRTDRRAERTLEASSRNGDITVRYRSG